MYGKLFSSMFDGTLGTKGPWQALVTFQQMIILADQAGIVDMTPEAISRRTTIPLEIIAQGLKELEQPDPGSRSPAENGCRITRLSDDRDWGWQIVNYAHYRAIRSADERREYMRQYQRNRRAVNKSKLVNHKLAESTNSSKQYAEAIKPLAADAAREIQTHPAQAFQAASRLDKRKSYIEAKAIRCGLSANPGETWAAFAGRVRNYDEVDANCPDV